MMSLLCPKFYNGSHFIQSKNGFCSFRAEQKVFPVACKSFSGLSPDHFSSIPPSLLLTHPVAATLETSLFLECAGHTPPSDCPLCSAPQTVPSARHALPPGLASSPLSSLYSNVISLKPDMTYFNCNPYTLVPYPSFEMCASPWRLLPSDSVPFTHFFCLLSVSPQ